MARPRRVAGASPGALAGAGAGRFQLPQTPSAPSPDPHSADQRAHGARAVVLDVHQGVGQQGQAGVAAQADQAVLRLF